MADFPALLRTIVYRGDAFLGYQQEKASAQVFLWFKYIDQKWYLDLDRLQTVGSNPALGGGSGFTIKGEKGIEVDASVSGLRTIRPVYHTGPGTELLMPNSVVKDTLVSAEQLNTAFIRLQDGFLQLFRETDEKIDSTKAELLTVIQAALDLINAIDPAAFVQLSNQATSADLDDSAQGKWVDSLLLRTKLEQLAQYVDAQFSIRMPDGSGATPGYVFTLRTAAGVNGEIRTKYGWEPLPDGTGTGGGGSTSGITSAQAQQLIDQALTPYAKLTDGAQKVIADDFAADLIRFNGDGKDIDSYDWVMGVRLSFQTNREHLMLANTSTPDGLPVLTQQDAIDILQLVRSWFVAAGLPEPAMPSYAVRGVAEALRDAVPPGNKLAPEAIDARLADVVGGEAGVTLAPAELERLRALVTATTWTGSPESLTAALPELKAILEAGIRMPADPFVHRSELQAGGGGGSGGQPEPLASVPQLRLRGLPAFAPADPVALPQQAWVRLPLTFPTEIIGTWEAQDGLVKVPETGQYELFFQCLTSLTSDSPSAELLLRVVGADGIYSGDSSSTTTLGAVLEHSAVIAAQAGDQLAIEAYTEASGVQLHPQTMVLRLRRTGASTRREVWLSPPAPWSAPQVQPAAAGTPAPRRIVLGVPAGALGSATSLFRFGPTVAAEGGAVAAQAASDGRSGYAVGVGSQIGRLFRVSGRVASATGAQLALVDNANTSTELQGVSPTIKVAGDPEQPRYPNFVTATSTATRSDFATPARGAFYNPQTLYVGTTNAKLELMLQGGNSSGGQVVLTDVTPGGGDYIGVDLVADKTFTQAARSGFYGMDLALIPDAQGLWVPDNPAFSPVGSKAEGYGHRFCCNNLPNGIYRVQAEFTITGEHLNAGLRPGWNCNSLVKDFPMPTYRVFNADGSVTYTIDTVYRMGTGDGGTIVGHWFSITPTATSIGKPISVKGWIKYRRLPPGTSTFTVELPFKAGQALDSNSSAALCFDLHGQKRSGPGLLLYNANGATEATDPYFTGATSWSGYGAPRADGPELASTHGLFMNVGQSQTNGCIWNAKMNLTVAGALASGSLVQRRVGANNNWTNLTSNGIQPDGTMDYTIDAPNLAQNDGQWHQNFLLAFARAATNGVKLVKGGITLTGTFNQFPFL